MFKKEEENYCSDISHPDLESIKLSKMSQSGIT